MRRIEDGRGRHEEGRMRGRRGTTTSSFPRVFDYDEEGGGTIGAPYSYPFVVARSRNMSMDNEAA
jgi:hypothetical protein